MATNPKHLGARIGARIVLHTGEQNLRHHPHLHRVVPGGGMSPDGSTFHVAECQAERKRGVRISADSLHGKSRVGDLGKHLLQRFIDLIFIRFSHVASRRIFRSASGFVPIGMCRPSTLQSVALSQSPFCKLVALVFSLVVSVTRSSRRWLKRLFGSPRALVSFSVRPICQAVASAIASLKSKTCRQHNQLKSLVRIRIEQQMGALAVFGQ